MSDATEDQLCDAREELLRAELEGDGVALDRLLGEGFHGIDPGGADLDRDDVIAGYTASGFTLETLRVEDVQVRVFGDVGLVTGRSTMEGRAGEEAFEGRYRYRDVWVRRDGAWRVVASQLTPITGDEPRSQRDGP